MTEISGRLLAVGTAGLSAALRKRGYHEVFVDGVRPLAPGMRLAGPARTLRFVPFRPDLFAERGGGLNPQKRAFDTVGDGEVLVIEARGRADAGTLGDILALRAHQRGAAGVITDGGVRDADAVAAIGMPVFAQGPHPSVLGRRHVPWETDVVITCGGAAVVPGDWIVADSDGVLVIPAALIGESPDTRISAAPGRTPSGGTPGTASGRTPGGGTPGTASGTAGGGTPGGGTPGGGTPGGVLAEAEEQERRDAWIAARVKEGESLDGLFPMDAGWRARYEAAQIAYDKL